MKKIKEICKAVVYGLFWVNVCSTIVSLLLGNRWDMKMLYLANIVVIIMTVSAVFILKERTSLLEKWIRRVILMVLWCTINTLTLWIFRYFNHTCGHTNYEFLFKSLAVSIPIMVMFCVIAYIIGDVCEKKYLKKINKKLSENAEDINSGDYTLS